MTRVITFGVFDGFHDGHKHFLHEASRRGDFLVVVVARDEVVEKLKGRKPRFSLEERMRVLEESGIADEVKAGDRQTGSWKIIRHVEPDIVMTGHDQHLIRESLEAAFPDRAFEIAIARPYKRLLYSSTGLYHSGSVDPEDL